MVWNPDGTFTANNYYALNTLSVTDGIDEDGIETLLFADLAGHAILKRQIFSPANLDTYYIYNSAGMLRYTVPPKAMAMMNASGIYNVTQSGISMLIFNYAYDTYGRLFQKTMPGNVKVNIIYDPLFRPVLTQDNNMAADNQWNYIKYDVKGRAISQGIYTDNTHIGQSAMQAYVNTLASNYSTAWYESKNGNAATGYYSNTIFPTANIVPLAYEFYDNYDLLNNGTAHYTYSAAGLPGEVGATAAQIKGMPTMVYKSTVSNTVSATWQMSVQFYDHNLHPIQSQTNNLLYTAGGASVVTDYKTTVPDFVGVPTVSLTSIKSAAATTTTVKTIFTYDPMHRVTAVDQSYNGAATVHVAAYSYNELGEVIKKSLGYVNSTTWLQNVNMRFSIRGQLLYINNSKLANDGGITSNDSNDLFGMQMLYDGTDSHLNNGAGNTAKYDGRLTAVKWMSTDAGNNKSYERSYIYSYDGTARYTGETYSERTIAGTGSFSNNLNGFDESGITYDENGNIQALNRNSSTQGTNTHIQIDNLNYTYSATYPNQLSTVTDGTGANYTGAGFRNLTGSTASYQYDVDGNLVTDPYKGLSIGYDVLNKTDKITVTTGTNQYINYVYDAGGGLLRKQAYNNGTLGTTTDYIGGFVYLTQGAGTAALSYFPMPEGRVVNNSGTLVQEFIITDQQGNARISFQDNGSGTAVVKQENSYYGFGLQLLNSPVSPPPVPNKQLYNGGSEWQNDYSNLPDYYQTFYRNYDAAIGRFVGIDPMPESAESMSSYQYAGNNPIMFNDPAGAAAYPGSHNPPSSWNPYHGILPASGPLDGLSFDQWAGAFTTASNYAGQIEYGGGSLPGGQDIFNTIFGLITDDIRNNNYNANINNSVATSNSGSVKISYQTSENVWQYRFVGDDLWRFINIEIVNHSITIPLANQGGDTVSMGVYGNLQVINYTKNDNGVTISLGVHNVTGYRTLRWLQTISTNAPLRDDLKSPYYDHYRNSALPFYPEFNLYGYDSELEDEPARNVVSGTDIYWRASSTLGGVVGNTFFPIFTVNWGFTIVGGVYNQIPMTFSTPLSVPQTFSPYFQRNGP